MAAKAALPALALACGSAAALRTPRLRGRRRRKPTSARGAQAAAQAAAYGRIGTLYASGQQVILSDVIAKSFLMHFNNAFLNTIEKVRKPHLAKVVSNLRDFAGRVPPKYRDSISKALSNEGFLSFLLSRAALSLLCAKATLPRSPRVGGAPAPSISQEHEELATVIEELYIAATLHAEEEWDAELKADGQTFMAIAMSFVKHLTDPTVAMQGMKQPNMEALLGFDANPSVWSKYAFDMLDITFSSALKKLGGTSPRRGGLQGDDAKDNRKISLLGGDSLYATAQWAMANIDSRECRKLISNMIATYSDGQLRRRELYWNTDLPVSELLENERQASVATFFSASAACAALVNSVDEDISKQLKEFGYDVGLIVGLLRDARRHGIRSALKIGRISAPVLFAVEQDPELRRLLDRQPRGEPWGVPGELAEAERRVQRHGVAQTLCLVNRLGSRAAARLECLEDGEEKEALLTVTLGMSCLPLLDGNNLDIGKERDVPLVLSEASPGSAEFFHNFDLSVENLRLSAQVQRLKSKDRRSRERLESISKVASGEIGEHSGLKRKLPGLGLTFDTQEIDWLLFRGLERKAPLPGNLELEALLSCIASDQKEVQQRLLALSDVAGSQKLRYALVEVFSAGGKRLRPALCHLVHQMLKAPADPEVSSGEQESPRPPPDPRRASEGVLKLATAIEVIHTASLVHDDILDDADTRRQRKTIHEVFGPDVAVLSGDFLFAHASELIESLENDEVTRLVSLVIEQFGLGEMSQSAKKFDTEVTLFDYMTKSFYKTASLLAAACRASAVLSGPSREVCDVMYSYGFYLGIAFQIADDVLDFDGDMEDLGKPQGQDLSEGLLTAPVILCLQGNKDLGLSPAPGAAEIRALISRRFSEEGDLERVVELVREGGGVEKAYLLAEQMANKALEALMLVAPVESEARRSLAGITRWAVRRSS